MEDNKTPEVETEQIENATEEKAEVETAEEPETFPREYVQKLRKESADHRAKAKDRDDLAQRLHTAQVAATGRLADPSDLAFDEALLDDEAALNAAIDALLEKKPHLASRMPKGDIGQGVGGGGDDVSLSALLRQGA